MNERNLPIERKIKLLEGQMRGKIPTKVIVRGNGQKEEINDMLSAVSIHTRICGDAVGKTADSGLKIKLSFNILGRNEPLKPALEAEFR